MPEIKMVDLKGQYQHIKLEIDSAIQDVIDNASFINGSHVQLFAEELSKYNGSGYVVPCANGTDAIQIALMALDLRVGDEVIVPSFTYAASAEAIALLKLTPVIVDVDYKTFNTTIDNICKAITKKTKAIIPVHLFGQSCDMEPIVEVAKSCNIHIIEDNAQSIGATYSLHDGNSVKAGAIGDFGCTSFFPSKNLGCYGDGGAIFTNDETLYRRAKMIANHGQTVKYNHKMIGCNSRLDTLQAAILRIKLKHLDEYCAARYKAATYYNESLKEVEGVEIPSEMERSTHVYHQYTLKINGGKRDELRDFLQLRAIPSMIYYPTPIHRQEAFQAIVKKADSLYISSKLSEEVISLPMHTELTINEQDFIIASIQDFFNR